MNFRNWNSPRHLLAALLLAGAILPAPGTRAADTPAAPTATPADAAVFHDAQKLLQTDSATDPAASAKKALAHIMGEVQQLTNAVTAATQTAQALPPTGADVSSLVAHINAEEVIAHAAGELGNFAKNWETHLAGVLKTFNVPGDDRLIKGFKETFGKGAPQMAEIYTAMRQAYATDADCLRILAANAGRWKLESGKRVFANLDLKQEYDAAMKLNLAATQAYRQLQAKILAAQKPASPTPPAAAKP